MQKFSGELERANQQREELEKELEVERKKDKLPEMGYKELENRWKLATNESAKLSFQVKTLRGENEMLTARQKEFQERYLIVNRIASANHLHRLLRHQNNHSSLS